MTVDLFSRSWHRVAPLRPRLRGHAQIHRHLYRGQVWYVLQDHASRRVHRFNPAAYELIGLMDGVRTVQDLWDIACARLGDDAPSQNEVIRLLGQLHMADALQCEVPADVVELLRRAARYRKNKLLSVLLSPLSIKFSLFDPERLLVRTLPLYRPLFSWFGALLWLCVVGFGVAMAGLHWHELTQDVVDRVLAVHNLAILLITFPLVKAVHEFGHACAVKRWGGEVHEMGIMLLVMMPIPYVDASAASAFRSRHQRVIVGSAGMLAELFIAAIAMVIWLNVEPGITRSVMYNVVLIAGVSTLFFNANPLLRYDGYYILCDLIEMPNLRQRSSRYLSYLTDRFLLGTPDVETPEATKGERRWCLLFGVASFIYRMFLMFAIGLFIAGKYFFVGVLLAIWAVIGSIVFPLVRGLYFLLYHPRLRRTRARAIGGTFAALGVIVALLFYIPTPLWTQAEGVVRVPDEAVIRAQTDGFVDRVVAPSDTVVRRGDAILTLSEPLLKTRLQMLEAKHDELQARYDAELVYNRVRTKSTASELGAVEAELNRTRDRSSRLTVVSPMDGRLVMARDQDMPAQFVHQGQTLAFVMDGRKLSARVIVSQQDVDLVRSRTQRVQVRLSDDLSRVVTGTIKREIPAATADLPSMALSVEGGGNNALDPREKSGSKALQKFFEFELELPAQKTVNFGGRVYVRFEHGSEPLAYRWYRGLRQVFLKRLSV
ncbi:MAG: PqqD family peptide modification chaperone [Betaproteobacteria bacterium]